MADFANTDSMPLTAILVDDEENARLLLKQRLNKFHPEIEVKELCANAKEALVSVIRHKPDLVFLDIQMPDMTGLEFFEHVHELGIPLQAIITTAFAEPEYYQKAIRLGLADYLLKPVIKEELDAAIENVRSRIRERMHYQQVGNIVGVLRNESKVCLDTASSKIYIKPVDILYACSFGKYSKIYFTNSEAETVMYGISELEDLLPYNFLVKIDRFMIINTVFVQKISPKLRQLVFSYNDNSLKLNITHSGAEFLIEHMQKEMPGSENYR